MRHQDLKEKALAATPGPWALGGARGNSAHVWGYQGATLIAECDRSKSLSHLAIVANSGFIAAANPAAVLALIEENEKLLALLIDVIEAGEVNAQTEFGGTKYYAEQVKDFVAAREALKAMGIEVQP